MATTTHLGFHFDDDATAPTTTVTLQKTMALLMRLSIGWTFLYAGVNQVMNPGWTAVRFLGGAKSLKPMFEFFASPAVIPYVDFMVQWGHLMIGLALITGICFRLSAGFGALLMIMYYLPRMDFPMVGAHNFIVEYHLVYAFLLIYLASIKAGAIGGVQDPLGCGAAGQISKGSGMAHLAAIV